MIANRIVSAVAAVFLFSTALQAGTPVVLDDLEGVIKSNPKFDALFIDNLEFATSGEALRLGRHFGAVSGTAVGPYRFPVRFSGSTGTDYPLQAVLHTELIFEDSSGKVIDADAAAGGAAVNVRERLVKVELLDAEEMTLEEKSRALDGQFEGAPQR